MAGAGSWNGRVVLALHPSTLSDGVPSNFSGSGDLYGRWQWVGCIDFGYRLSLQRTSL
jgi:hypothetical protein